MQAEPALLGEVARYGVEYHEKEYKTFTSYTYMNSSPVLVTTVV